jgi:predicted NAD/FAD-dependent oxidoreductase
MQPCWTLMGISDDPAPEPDWDLARPATGPLAWVIRNDARPGRQRVAGQAHWVVHARAGWSRSQLEQPAAWVQGEMQAALADCLGRPLAWQHSVVHRWRYAAPPVTAPARAEPCWWDAARGLGVCGDFLGGMGAEGAWLSAQSLSAALLQSAFVAGATSRPAAALPLDPEPVPAAAGAEASP